MKRKIIIRYLQNNEGPCEGDKHQHLCDTDDPSLPLHLSAQCFCIADWLNQHPKGSIELSSYGT